MTDALHLDTETRPMDALQQLVEIEAIKQLKARYMRAVDTKDWPLLESTFSPDARSVYNSGKHAFEGRAAILGFLKDALDNDHVITMHHSHTPEIEITSETTARGHWYLEDFVINEGAGTAEMAAGTVLHGTGIYSDEYVRIDGEWKIALTGYERIFEDIQPRQAGSKLKTRWNAR
jgi:hypothetical protein